MESELENSLLQSNALRQAVLRAAFSGQLIPQNPDDELASELLKRIAAERVKREIAKPRKPRGRRGRKPRKRAEKSRQGTPL